MKKLKITINDPIVCETCNGEGYIMTAKLYPTGHTEIIDTCPDCNGDGFVESF